MTDDVILPACRPPLPAGGEDLVPDTDAVVIAVMHAADAGALRRPTLSPSYRPLSALPASPGSAMPASAPAGGDCAGSVRRSASTSSSWLICSGIRSPAHALLHGASEVLLLV
jgi:hypothetical protein